MKPEQSMAHVPVPRKIATTADGRWRIVLWYDYFQRYERIGEDWLITDTMPDDVNYHLLAELGMLEELGYETRT